VAVVLTLVTNKNNYT